MFTYLKSSLLAVTLLIASASSVYAGPRSGAMTTAAAEARNETATPGYATQMREARQVSHYLADTLQLTNAQFHVIQGLILAEEQALVLAVTATDINQAQQHFLQKVRQTLTISQMANYTVFCGDSHQALLSVND